MLIQNFHHLGVSDEDRKQRKMGNQCPQIHLSLAKNQLDLALITIYFLSVLKKKPNNLEVRKRAIKVESY